MCSEVECSICYRTYDTGPRCPRELRCGHTFCESCLSTLATRGAGTRRQLSIACPLCRHCTPLPAGGVVRQALHVDEDVLSQMVAAGLLEGTLHEDSDSEDGDGGEGDRCDRKTAQTEAEPRTRTGKLWKSLKRLCGRLDGNSSRSCHQSRSHRMTDEDLKDLALMSCYMM